MAFLMIIMHIFEHEFFILHEYIFFPKPTQVLAFEAGHKGKIRVNTISAGIFFKRNTACIIDRLVLEGIIYMLGVW